MEPTPLKIDGATIVQFTPIDKRHRHTGNCRQIIAGVLQGPSAALAICRHDGEENVYLFGCDEQWSCLTDTWHETIEDAMRQAEFEYEGSSATWLRPN